jgi:type I restriction enzyme S subunit
VNSIEYGAIASSLMIVKPNKEVISNFLYYYFQSNLCMNMIKKYKGGAAQPNLGAKDVKKFDICIPSLIEQESIIKKLDQLSDKTKKLESLYQQKLENIEELKKSILQKAFGGEL